MEVLHVWLLTPFPSSQAQYASASPGALIQGNPRHFNTSKHCKFITINLIKYCIYTLYIKYWGSMFFLYTRYMPKTTRYLQTLAVYFQLVIGNTWFNLALCYDHTFVSWMSNIYVHVNFLGAEDFEKKFSVDNFLTFNIESVSKSWGTKIPFPQ